MKKPYKWCQPGAGGAAGKNYMNLFFDGLSGEFSLQVLSKFQNVGIRTTMMIQNTENQ